MEVNKESKRIKLYIGIKNIDDAMEMIHNQIYPLLINKYFENDNNDFKNIADYEVLNKTNYLRYIPSDNSGVQAVIIEGVEFPVIKIYIPGEINPFTREIIVEKDSFYLMEDGNTILLSEEIQQLEDIN